MSGKLIFRSEGPYGSDFVRRLNLADSYRITERVVYMNCHGVADFVADESLSKRGDIADESLYGVFADGRRASSSFTKYTVTFLLRPAVSGESEESSMMVAVLIIRSR